MVQNLISWVKTHKLILILALLVLYLLVPKSTPIPFALDSRSVGLQNTAVESVAPSFGMAGKVAPGMMPIISQDYAPAPDVTNRLVVQNSYLSLLVKDVVLVRKQILEYTTSIGGYMVNVETTNPQDAPTATVTVRVPANGLDAALETFRGLGVKVVSENLIGNDVTDQYVDIEARIATLTKTKATMEALLSRATEVSDLTNITQQVINIQSQIDSYTGTQKSLAENAKLAKVTVYLSTDEIALPYAPTDTFRPAVIFKLAVRSLVTHLRSLGSLAIWVAVYSVIWVPAIIVIYLLYKKFNKKV